MQGSVSYLDRDYWELSDDFVPTTIEDGGERNGSDNRDSRANVKVGFTPNDTRRVLAELHRADGREGRAAARAQQPAESAEQLLALADVGHRQSLLAVRARSSARTTT